MAGLSRWTIGREKRELPCSTLPLLCGVRILLPSISLHLYAPPCSKFDAFVELWNGGRLPTRYTVLSERELRRADTGSARTAHAWAFALSDRESSALLDTTDAVGDATTTAAAATAAAAAVTLRGAAASATFAPGGRGGAPKISDGPPPPSRIVGPVRPSGAR